MYITDHWPIRVSSVTKAKKERVKEGETDHHRSTLNIYVADLHEK